MNAWLTRVLGGAACTVGVLAFGVGVAHADEQQDHGLLHAVVSVATAHHTGSHHTGGHASSTHHPSSSHTSHSSHSTPAVHVRASVHVLEHPSIRVTARVSVGKHHAPHAAPVRLRVSAKAAPVHVRATAKARFAPVRVRVAGKATLHPTTVRGSVRVQLGRTPRGSSSATHQHPARPLVSVVEVARVGTSRTHLLSAASDTRLRVLDLPVGVCLRLNAGRCDSGVGGQSGGTTGSATSPGSAGSTRGTAGLATVSVGVTTRITHVLGAAVCLEVNAGGCGQGTSGNRPSDPGHPVTAPVGVETGGFGGFARALVRSGQTPTTAAFDLGRPTVPGLAGPLGTMPMLARTGLSRAGTILLGAGVLLMMMGFAALALRRRH